MKYLPGVRVSWDLPGFRFLNTDFAAYLDESRGLAVEHTASQIIDINWSYPFAVGGQKFSFEGHVEYVSARKNRLDEIGRDNRVRSWVLAQPQFRWDLGNTLTGVENKFFVGIEYQYWRHKLGTASNERVAQLLLVWRL